MVWLVFKGWAISYANKWEDHSNYWGTAHSLSFDKCLGTVLAPLGVSFNLQIEDQGLVEVDLSVILDPFDLIGLCYVLGLFHSLKSCALPPSLLSHALFVNPVWDHNVASIIFWQGNQKIRSPKREGLYVYLWLIHVEV